MKEHTEKQESTNGKRNSCVDIFSNELVILYKRRRRYGKEREASGEILSLF